MNTATSNENENPEGWCRESSTNAVLFVSLWALFFLVHQLKHVPWLDDMPVVLRLVRVGMVVSALAVIWRPSSLPWFLLMVASQVASVVILLPGMSNCWLFAGLVGVGILGAAAHLRLRPAESFTIESLYAQMVPMLRTSLLVLYAFAALAKYNYDFLDPDISCAAYIARLFAESIGLPFNDSAAVLSAWTAIIVETAIPIMLFLPATRRHGIILGMLFHTLLAHDSRVHVFDFNAMVFALYVTFLPANFSAQVQRCADTGWIRSLAAVRHLIVSVAIMISMAVLWWSCRTESLGALYQYRSTLWLAVGLTLTIAAVQTLFCMQAEYQQAETAFRLRIPFDYVAVGLVAFNGLSPYLGMKTVVSYTMFSNLHTEAGFENHALMPKWLRCCDWQDEPVRIIDSSAPELAEAGDRGDLLLLFDLRLRAQRLGKHSVTYEQDGVTHHIPRMADDPFLGRPLPYLVTKTQLFRPIQTRADKPQW